MLIIKNLLSGYHDWMLDKIEANLPEHRKYKSLLSQMDDLPFIVVDIRDENRALDGKILRLEFLEDEGLDESYLWREEPTILEVLVALSIRIEREITGEVGNDHLDRWFWIMISNLGLDKFDDEAYDKKKVTKILDNFVNRKYERNGKFCLFPLKKTDIDEKGIDLWYQMQLYLAENWEY